LARVDDVEPQVRVTSTVPSACAGATTVAVVALLNTALVTGVPPNETMQPADRLVPWSDTFAPPDTVPIAGSSDVRDGEASVTWIIRSAAAVPAPALTVIAVDPLFFAVTGMTAD
jgi:hypothetical protein